MNDRLHRRSIRPVFIAALLCFSLGIFGQDANPTHVIVRKLSNGMTVWLNEDHAQPKVFGAVVVKAGAKDCPNTGIAHYFEHILFKGTDHIGTVDYDKEKPWLDSISARYDELAATKDAARRLQIQRDINQLSQRAADYAIPNEFGDLISTYGGTGLNAYTSLDETVFHNSFAPQYLSQWCQLNSERLLNPVFRLFQGELETVYEEKNMYADNMGREAVDHAQARLFDGTPYASTIIGSTENLKNPRLSEMRTFFEHYYVAGNMGLILTGDIRADSIMPLLEQTFGRLRAGEAPRQAPFQFKTLRADDVLKLKVPIPIVKAAGYVFRAPTEHDADYDAFHLAMALLSNNSQTGLLDSLTNENKVMGAQALSMELKETAVAGFGYVPNLPFGTRKKADRLCWAQINKLEIGDFSQQTLDALKMDDRRNVLQSLENMDSRKSLLINAFSHGLDWNSDVLGRSERIKAVTKADVMRVARKYFGSDYQKLVKTFGHYPKDKVSQPGYTPVHPTNAGKKSAYAQELARQPFLQVAPKLVDFAHDVSTRQLSPLVTLYTARNPVNDLFQLQLIYHKGSRQDRQLEAAANYLDAIGTDSLTRHKFNKALQDVGARLSFSANDRQFVITLSGFDQHLRDALALLHHFIGHAKANSKMFHDLITSQKMEEKTFFKDNTTIADAVFERVAYGDSSSYLTHLSTAELKKIDGEQLLRSFRNVLSEELSIVYSGRLSDEQVEQAVRHDVPIDLVSHHHEDVSRPLMKYAEPVVYVYDYPDARQNVLGTYEQLPAAPTEEARARMGLWGHYFGSGMSSLLFQNIREFRAYAYYAYGYQMLPSLLLHGDRPTAYVTRLGTQADKSMLALSALDSLFIDMPVRETNIAAAKQQMLNDINNSYPNFRRIGQYVAGSRLEGYTDDSDRPATQILPTLGIGDVTDFYAQKVKGVPHAWIIVGNKRTLDKNRLARYGRIIELKKADIYR
jgi:predicted Zn-dependent peptidase